MLSSIPESSLREQTSKNSASEVGEILKLNPEEVKLKLGQMSELQENLAIIMYSCKVSEMSVK